MPTTTLWQSSWTRTGTSTWGSGLGGRIPMWCRAPLQVQWKEQWGRGIGLSFCLFIWLIRYESTNILPIFVMWYHRGLGKEVGEKCLPFPSCFPLSLPRWLFSFFFGPLRPQDWWIGDPLPVLWWMWGGSFFNRGGGDHRL